MHLNGEEEDNDPSNLKRRKNEDSTFELPHKKEKSMSLEPLPPKRELKMKSDDEGEEFLILPQAQSPIDM
tara:strand:- start:439 stop:648 length:210 start_codon:yes stop_codon:yes gene_type:complete